MNIHVVKYFDAGTQIPVFKQLSYTVNGKKKIARVNVNNKLDWNGKLFPQRKGGWSTEQQEGFRGDY